MEETGSTWPPRSYPCTFCERGFTSAQALGGHMNVHRRDRARSRQCSPQHHANHQLSVHLPGAHVTVHSTSSAEDQMASVYKIPISTDRQSQLIPLFRACSPSRSSLVLHASSTTRYLASNEDHHGGWDPRDREKQVKMEGIEDGLDLELRLGEKP